MSETGDSQWDITEMTVHDTDLIELTHPEKQSHTFQVAHRPGTDRVLVTQEADIEALKVLENTEYEIRYDGKAWELPEDHHEYIDTYRHRLTRKIDYTESKQLDVDPDTETLSPTEGSGRILKMDVRNSVLCDCGQKFTSNDNAITHIQEETNVEN